MKKQPGILREPLSEHGTGAVVLYNNPDGTVSLDVRLERDTLWLNLNKIAFLFDRDKSVVSRHLRNVFASQELVRDSVVAFFATTAAALFLWFMEKNGLLYCADGSRHIANNALVAITLMIAESKPAEKDVLTKVVVNLIAGKETG